MDNRIEGVVITFFETTERRRALAALELSDQRLRGMINIEGVGVVTFERDGRLLDANDAFRAMTGYGAKEISSGSLSWQRLTPPDFVEVSERQLERLDETGRMGPYEKQYIRADGSLSWILFAGARMSDGTIIEYCIDVSDRKRVEAALAQSEQRYRALVNATSYIIFRMSPDWSEMRELDGRGVLRDIKEPSKAWIDEFILPEEREHVLAAVRQAVATKSVFEMEHRIRRVDGTLGWAFSRAVPMLDEQGEIVEWFGAASDISLRRDAEQATAVSEVRFRLVMEGASDFAMILFDEHGRIVAWNAGAERLIGFTEAEVLGGDGDFIFTPEDRAAAVPERERQQALAAGRAIDERWHMRKDGSRFWASGVMNSLRTPQGLLRGYLKIMRDETSRKQTEEALQNAKAAAEEANRVKDEFLATLSHELRTPLSSILIWSKLLRRRGDAPPEYIEALDAITNSAEAQKQLIDDLLDTSRITAGKLRLNMRPTDLAPLVRSGIEAVQPTADAKNVAVEINLGSNVGIVQADPDRLRQVVWNLLLNAVKFTPAGGKVRVGLSRHGRSVEIRVSDTGRGIDTRFLPHIFEPFRQAESATTRSRGGLGLGLSICKQLVEQHGGTITAESAGVNQGSVFTVELPLPRVRTRGGEPAVDGGSVVSPLASLSLLDGKRILLVEDEPATRTAFATLLSDAGANVTAVESVEQALTALTSSPRPTLLITDIAMAGADGYELIRQVRAMKGPVAAIPAVALTAFARAEDRDKALSSGFDRHVGKPVDPEQLLSVLCELLDERLG